MVEMRKKTSLQRAVIMATVWLVPCGPNCVTQTAAIRYVYRQIIPVSLYSLNCKLRHYLYHWWGGFSIIYSVVLSYLVILPHW